MNETVIQDNNMFPPSQPIAGNNLINNPIAMANFDFSKSNNNTNTTITNPNIPNSNPQPIKNINPDNPEDILMDESFWNILPNKKTDIQTGNNIATNTNTNTFNNMNFNNLNNVSNNQSNLLKNSVMDFNFNNSAAPTNRTIIPEFNFDLPKQPAQVPFETSFNINNVQAGNVNPIPNNIPGANFNNNLNNSHLNNMSNVNYSNFNINTFDRNLMASSVNFQPNSATNFNVKPNEDLSRKQNSYDFNFSNLLKNDNFKLLEDDFDPSTIKKQIRGAIIVRKVFNLFS